MLWGWGLSFLAGARRWINPEAAKALALVIVSVTAVAGGVLLYGAGTSGGAAKRDASWLTRLNAATAAVMKKRADRERDLRIAESVAREKAESDRDDAIARAAAIATELARLQDDPVVYPRRLAKEMRR